MAADGGQLARGHGDGVAGGEKERLDVLPVCGAGGVEILADILDRPHPVGRPLFVDHAEGALVVRAAHGGLDQQAVGLTGWTVDRAFVAQQNAFLIFLNRRRPVADPKNPSIPKVSQSNQGIGNLAQIEGFEKRAALTAGSGLPPPASIEFIVQGLEGFRIQLDTISGPCEYAYSSTQD